MSSKGKKNKNKPNSEDKETKKTKKNEKDTKDEKKEGLIIGYWKIRGLAQPLRLVLEYQNVPYTDKYYVSGTAPDFSREQWLSEKYKLGLPLPNLPYLIDGNLKITESNAILNYVGTKNENLCGENPSERAVIEMILGHTYDFRSTLVRLAYDQKYEEKKESWFNNTFAQFKKECEQLIGDKKWFADKLSVADFVLYELFDQVLLMNSKALDDAPHVKAFLERFEALPRIAAYLKSDRYLKKPCNNPQAGWNPK